MFRLLFIVVVVYLVYQLVTNWHGAGTRDIRDAAEDAGQKVENSTVGREVKRSVETLENYLP